VRLSASPSGVASRARQSGACGLAIVMVAVSGVALVIDRLIGR
jgi:hypothetical protein